MTLLLKQKKMTHYFKNVEIIEILNFLYEKHSINIYVFFSLIIYFITSFTDLLTLDGNFTFYMTVFMIT